MFAGSGTEDCFMKRLFSMARLAVCALTALGVFALLSLGCNQTQKHIGPREKIAIAHWTGLGAALVHIAFVKGYFQEEGLDATLQPYSAGKFALDAVIKGKADLATVGDTPFMFAVMNNKKVSLLAAIQTSSKLAAIVARRDRGIIRPADIKGKKIGVTFNSTPHFFLFSFLVANNIAMKDVTLINVTPDEMGAVLNTGVVDAVSTYNSTVRLLEKGLGKRGVVFFGESLYSQTYCLASSQEYVKKNPEVIKKVLRALLKAETFMQEHSKEARNLATTFVKLDKAVLDGLWDALTFRVTLDQALLVDLEHQTRWALKNRLTARKSMPNYLDYIYVDGLYSVRPVSVRIVR